MHILDPQNAGYFKLDSARSSSARSSSARSSVLLNYSPSYVKNLKRNKN